MRLGPVAWSHATSCRPAQIDVPPRASARRCPASWRWVRGRARSPGPWGRGRGSPAAAAGWPPTAWSRPRTAWWTTSPSSSACARCGRRAAAGCRRPPRRWTCRSHGTAARWTPSTTIQTSSWSTPTCINQYAPTAAAAFLHWTPSILRVERRDACHADNATKMLAYTCNLTQAFCVHCVKRCVACDECVASNWKPA